MPGFLARRAAQGILVLVGVAAIVFVLARLTGDPVQLLLPDRATPAEVAAMRDRLGLNDPLPLQFVRFVESAVHGDFGNSIRFRQPALDLVLGRLPATALLAGLSLLLALLLSVPMGIVAAVNRGGLIDRALMSVSLLGYAVPTFWLGIMLILIFSVELRLFPPSGFGSPSQLVLPVSTLGVYEAALLARLLRRGIVDAFAQPYIQTAHAKGLTPIRILIVHTLRNAAIPVVTVFGLQLGSLLGGAVITETVFSYPGVGLLLVQAIGQRDFPIIQAFVIVSAAIVVVINLIVDLTYAALDPRIRHG
jgi:peptide/nickel transport system permease protein